MTTVADRSAVLFGGHHDGRIFDLDIHGLSSVAPERIEVHDAGENPTRYRLAGIADRHHVAGAAGIETVETFAYLVDE